MVKLQYPASKNTICQKFGEDNSTHPIRYNYYTLFDNKHPGVDFCLPIGTQIIASYPGIVVRKEYHEGMGKVVGIRNGNIVFLYAHLDSFEVKLGEILNAGNIIGESGESGNVCTTPHLHFEMRDITKKSLKDMVFNPPFENELSNHQPEFTYVVNNNNTQKSLITLSIRFFGTEAYWQHIANRNNINISKSEILKDRDTVIIPNY